MWMQSAAAFCGAVAVYWSVAQWLAPGGQRAMRFSQPAEARPVLDQIGDQVLIRGGALFTRWRREARWASLGQTAPGRPLPRVAGLSAALGLAGLASASLTGAPALWLAAGLAAAWPWLQLRAQAELARRRVRRALPELAALLAAELAANTPAERALERLAAGPGPLAAILHSALQQSQLSNRPLFSHRPFQGTLLEAALFWDLPPLIACMRQLDLAATQGVAGAEQLQRAARGLTRDYREELLRRSERLESTLMVPSMLFVFLPFLVAVIATVGIPVLEAFR